MNGAATEVQRPLIQVACGVLQRADGTVLLAQRPVGKIAAGKWEFPGGKIEDGEDAAAALRRELREELGIELRCAEPLLCFRHDYHDRSVVLDTWRVLDWHGEPQGHEGQALRWLPPAQAQRFDVLPTVAPILAALRLPLHYVFTPPHAPLARLQAGLAQLPAGAWLRLRQPDLSDDDYAARAQSLLPQCRQLGLRVLLDRAPELALALGADGWHASETHWRGLGQRPVPLELYWAASAHDAAGLAQLRALGADAAVLGPVNSTATHPGAPALGWPAFTALLRDAGLPVYGIGGLTPAQLAEARACGAVGIAAIRAYWPST